MNIDWRNDAACLEYDPETFFPEAGPGAMRQFREAQRICGGCSVRAECLADALESGDVHGIRAGLGEKERRKLIRAAGSRTIRRYELAPCGTLAAYQRHHRRREPVCEACAAVNRRNSADRAKARREAAA